MLMSALSIAASDIKKRDFSKARMIHQFYKTKEFAKTRGHNKKLIENSFDELHARIVDLVRHEKRLIKRQEEDEHHFKSLKTHIEHLEERLKKSEKMLRHAFYNTQKIDEIDVALSSLYKKVIRVFDLKKSKEAKTKKGKSKARKAPKAMIERLKKALAGLESRYRNLKKKGEDTEKLEIIREKIELLKGKLE